jgi:hypothetical protein
VKPPGNSYLPSEAFSFASILLSWVTKELKEVQMKGSMKKLMVFVMIAAITIFIAAATASAGDHHRKAIHGVYGWAGTGHCMPTDVDGIPLSDTNGHTNRFFSTSQGTITFKHNGTGKVRFTGTGGDNTGAVNYEAQYDHEYHIAPDGAITIDMVENSYVQTFPDVPDLKLCVDFLNLKGWISADQETITIATPKRAVNKNWYGCNFSMDPGYSICNFSFTLVRLSD